MAANLETSRGIGHFFPWKDWGRRQTFCNFGKILQWRLREGSKLLIYLINSKMCFSAYIKVNFTVRFCVIWCLRRFSFIQVKVRCLCAVCNLKFIGQIKIPLHAWEQYKMPICYFTHSVYVPHPPFFSYLFVLSSVFEIAAFKTLPGVRAGMHFIDNWIWNL